jgi:hypothetical protein
MRFTPIVEVRNNRQNMETVAPPPSLQAEFGISTDMDNDTHFEIMDVGHVREQADSHNPPESRIRYPRRRRAARSANNDRQTRILDLDHLVNTWSICGKPKGWELTLSPKFQPLVDNAHSLGIDPKLMHFMTTLERRALHRGVLTLPTDEPRDGETPQNGAHQ